jgi:hypothetical protein
MKLLEMSGIHVVLLKTSDGPSPVKDQPCRVDVIVFQTSISLRIFPIGARIVERRLPSLRDPVCRWAFIHLRR